MRRDVMASSPFDALTKSINAFKQSAGLIEPNDSPVFRFGMDANNALFWIEQKLKVIQAAAPLDQNSFVQYELLAQISLCVSQLKVNIKFENGFDDNHPACKQLDKATDAVLKLQTTHFPTLHAAAQLMIQLESLKEDEKLNKAHQAMLNNLVINMKALTHENNLPAQQLLINIMQTVITAYYTARAPSGFTLYRMPDNPLADALESIINNQMQKMGEANGIPVPSVAHRLHRGDSAPSLTSPAVTEKRESHSSH